MELLKNEWCGEEDSNFHGPKPTSPSSWRVYQFRHRRTGANTIPKLPACAQGRGTGKMGAQATGSAQESVPDEVRDLLGRGLRRRRLGHRNLFETAGLLGDLDLLEARFFFRGAEGAARRLDVEQAGVRSPITSVSALATPARLRKNPRELHLAGTVSFSYFFCCPNTNTDCEV